MSGPRLSIIPAGAIFDRTLEPRDLQVLNLLGCQQIPQLAFHFNLSLPL